MSCPFFYPTSRLDEGAWAVPPRLPLGDAYDGECRAGAAPYHPDEPILRSACNTGYARGRCGRFPGETEIDAIRFHLASDAGTTLRIQYIFEKRCWPAGHGLLDYPGGGEPDHLDPLVRRQGAAFAESYLRRAR